MSSIRKINNNSGIDKDVFKDLYEQYYTGLCYYAQNYIREIETVEDIVHEVFINLWNKRASIDLDKAVKAYLYRSVYNRCINYIRDHKKFDKNTDPDYLGLDNTSYSDSLEQEETESKIMNSIDSLPEKCKQIFRMNRFEELKYKEIADKLQISVKTVEAQMSKALKILRTELKDYLKILVLFIINLFNG